MADTTRKKAASFDRTTVSKDQSKEKGAETTKYVKPIVKSPKPPLPPRPPGLSKKLSQSKLSHRQKEKAAHNANHDAPSRPRRPPPPPSQASNNTPCNTHQENGKEVENKTTEITKVSTPENSIPIGPVCASKDIIELENVPPDVPQVETSPVSKQCEQETVSANTDTKHSENISDVESTENESEPNIPVAVKPSRLENTKTTIESNDPELKKPHTPSVTEASNTDEKSSEQSSLPHKTISKTPERPKPPVRLPSVTTDHKLNTLYIDGKNCSGTSGKTPEKPRPPKVTPPVPPKPDSPHTGRKLKSTPSDVVGKQSPPVQPRKSKNLAKATEPASGIAQENVVEKSENFVVETSNKEETYSLENTSCEVDVVPPESCDVSEDTGDSQNPGNVGSDSSKGEKTAEEKVTLLKTERVESSEGLAKKEVKPPRPRAPLIRKTEENELTNHDNSLSEVSPIKTSAPVNQQSCSPANEEHENNETETSVKPSRPRPPSRKTEDEKILQSCEDSTLPEETPVVTSSQDHNVVAPEVQPESSKPGKSPKPSRPRAPSRKTKDEMIGHPAIDNPKLLETSAPEGEPSCKPVKDEVKCDNNNSEKTTPSKPSRPSKPTRPPSAIKHAESNEEHENKSSKHQNDEKPSRPLEPKLSTEPVVVKDSASDREPRKNKPQRPSQPNLSNDAKESEQKFNKSQDIESDNAKMNHAVCTNGSEVDKSEMADMKKKHEVKSDGNGSVKRTGSIKPSRPPEPSETKRDKSSHETPTAAVAGKPKPPRPHAPRHEKNITVDKHESVETPPKPPHHEKDMKRSETPPKPPHHEQDMKRSETPPKPPHHEKDMKRSETPPKPPHHEQDMKRSETPPKPKRTSITKSHEPKPQQIETDQETEIPKLQEVHNAEENTNLNDVICGEPESTGPSDVTGQGTEGEVEEKIENVLVEKPEETSNGSEKLSSCNLEQSTSPNSPVQKNENTPFTAVNRQEKQDSEETSETSEKKCSDRHNVRFRVSSLSKTEVESFNRKEFLEKLKDKGYRRRSSEDDSTTAPQVRPKPSRPRPPSSGEHEVKVEGNETSEGKEHTQAKASALSNENISERSLSDEPVDVENKSEPSDVTRSDKVDIAAEVTAGVGAKESEAKCNDVVQDLSKKEKKLKRKAPPAPDETREGDNHVGLKQQDLKERKSGEKETINDQQASTKPQTTKEEKQTESTAGVLDEQTVKDIKVSTQSSEHTRQFVEEEKTERNDESVEEPAQETVSNTERESTEKHTEATLTDDDSSSKNVQKDHEGVATTEVTDAVQSPKKKTPPPKPKRTSSLKRDSKLVVPKHEANEEETPSTTETARNSSSDPLNEITEENVDGKPARHVVVEKTSEKEHPSKPVSRSKSFAPPGKARVKDSTARESRCSGGEERISRSFSFGAKRNRQQPARPSPPTFFVTEMATEESTNEIVSEEPSTDDVDKEKDISSSQEDLVEPETSPNDTKHDSVLTTDSESESEKEKGPQKSKIYYISREILTTERSFVDVVKLVSEDFREAVKNGNAKFGRAIIPNETLQDIVMNISQIYDLDSAFLKALEDRMETWEEEQRIGDIIKTFSPFLKMYNTYIQGYDNAMAILTESLKKYPQFAEVVREFECSERCRNLTVGMYMLKPIQRIPSYRLLLMDYLKHLSKDSLDHKDVSDALAIVSEVATHINEDMKRADNFEEVLKVQRSLVGQVEIVKPGRELIKEGTLMKLSRKEMQPRMFYLFTDILLYTTPVANNQFRLNLTLPLEEIKVELPASPDFENEFSIISTKKSFIMSASTPEERDEWLEALRNASDEIRKKKISFHLAKKEKLEALYDAQQHEDDKDAKLGSKAPVWIPDARVTMCMLCIDGFTVTNRRHHCRACGKVACGSCSSNSAPLAYLNSETARVCDICYEELTVKAASAQTVVAAKENGLTTEGKESPPKPAPKKSRRHKFFKSKEVPAVEESTISGYLKTRVGKKWQKRWYVVKDNVLYASKASSDPAAQETRPLLGYDIRGPEKMDGDSKKIVFQLIHAGTEPVVLQTDNMKHGEQWVNALRRATILPM